ncbi:hypothetical protein [Roseimaritima ulvae]|uniref:AAA+ ATPase domain-containing protein n=1 Tax=Roseimaritima ulvae TaxID=980254 RepID=A0A5B9QL77_9BACT|nr:hypothetical protein [Roseimaritima ulvae]QEG38532.1 hypothetical protein UC8_04890 [Roseimaritima ulvae]
MISLKTVNLTADSKGYVDSLGGLYSKFQAVTVTMSYHSFWSLRSAPFGAGELGQQFFAAKPQREAFARLHYMVENGHSTGLLIGPLGCGRSALLKQIASSRGFGDTAVDVALTACGQRNTDETLRSLATQLGASPVGELWRAISERVLASARQKVRTLWLIDDTTSEIVRLAAALVSESRWVTVIAVTPAEQAISLANHLGLCPLRIDLTPFSLADTMQFVRYRLSEAQASEPIFSDSALVRLHELGDGCVGVIEHLAELSMSAAAAHGVREIGAHLIEAVQEEFVRAA